MKVKELITFWTPFAVLVVIGRRLLKFITELFTGVIVCLVVVIVREKRKKVQ